MLKITPIYLLLSLGKIFSLECPLFNTAHCQTDCLSIPIDIVCEGVGNSELSGLLSQYANASAIPLRLTIKRSHDLQLSPSLFASVIPILWDLRIKEGTIVNEIPKNSFTGLRNLRYLDLSGNKIAHLHAEDFSGLELIRGINLKKNPLIGITSGVFDKLSDLRCLDLDDNALTCDCKLLWFKKWAMDHPQFWNDDQELYKAKDKGFDLKRVSFSVLDQLIADSHEDSEDCDGDMAECEYPPVMHDKNVTDIPQDVCDNFLSDAECLDLQTTHCKFYCDNWTPMQLQCAGVEYSELQVLLDKYSRYADRFLRIDITKSSDLILNSSLWEPVKDQLVHLNIDHSRLTLRPETFSNLNKLIYLQLEDNEISNIPGGAFNGLRALKGLSLDDSSVEHIDPTAFVPLTSLTCLKLEDQDDNLCDCDMQWLQKWSRNHTEYFGEKSLMYDFGVKVFCEGDSNDCSGKVRSGDDC